MIEQTQSAGDILLFFKTSVRRGRRPQFDATV
jgi:hypothetical protein